MSLWRIRVSPPDEWSVGVVPMAGGARSGACTTPDIARAKEFDLEKEEDAREWAEVFQAVALAGAKATIERVFAMTDKAPWVVMREMAEGLEWWPRGNIPPDGTREVQEKNLALEQTRHLALCDYMARPEWVRAIADVLEAAQEIADADAANCAARRGSGRSSVTEVAQAGAKAKLIDALAALKSLGAT